MDTQDYISKDMGNLQVSEDSLKSLIIIIYTEKQVLIANYSLNDKRLVSKIAVASNVWSLFRSGKNTTY